MMKYQLYDSTGFPNLILAQNFLNETILVYMQNYDYHLALPILEELLLEMNSFFATKFDEQEVNDNDYWRVYLGICGKVALNYAICSLALRYYLEAGCSSLAAAIIHPPFDKYNFFLELCEEAYENALVSQGKQSRSRLKSLIEKNPISMKNRFEQFYMELAKGNLPSH